MYRQSDQDDNSLNKIVSHKMEMMQSPIATIEIYLHLLAEETQSEQLSLIREALHKIRIISKQCLDMQVQS